MFGLSRALQVWVYTEPTDMRKSFNRLSALVTVSARRCAVARVDGFESRSDDGRVTEINAAKAGEAATDGARAGQEMVGNLPKPPRGPGSVPKAERDPKRVWTRT